MSQSSSSPLHVSIGDEQAPGPGISHAAVHVPEPVVLQVVVQATQAPSAQVKPSSIPPTQLSSSPLHVSAGGVQAAGAGTVQRAPQLPVPVERT